MQNNPSLSRKQSSLREHALINYAAYPIDQMQNQQRSAVVKQVQQALANDGCAVLENFLSQEGLQALLNEALTRKDQAYYSPKKECNVYLGKGDESLPNDHPVNIFMERSNGFVTADLLGNYTASRQLYLWPSLMQFLADCLGKEQLYVYDDPISNMIVNVNKPGQQFNWHFDTNEFTITMLLQGAQSGGHFEYVPCLRNKEDECYEEVKKVLDGERSRVKRLKLQAGDLQFFKGRFSLHQVTKNTGDIDRLLLIMSFTEKAGVLGSTVRIKDLYGKITQAHLDHEKHAVRADKLKD